MTRCRPADTEGRVHWTTEMILRLRIYWAAGMPIREIASLLTSGISYRVRTKAWRLKLGPHPNPRGIRERVKPVVVPVVAYDVRQRAERKCLKPNWDHKPRKCLGCAETFKSEGAHERICPRCKGTESWRSGIMEYRV